MLKNDFPERWSNVIDEIIVYLKSDNSSYWVGGIIAFSSFVKAFEYVKAGKSPINNAIKVLLPGVYNVMCHIVSNTSQESVTLQKIIIKSYYKLVQVSINLLISV